MSKKSAESLMEKRKQVFNRLADHALLEKRCPECGQVKRITDFGMNSQRRDGRAAYCRSCVSAHNRAYYLANRDDRIARNRAWERANPEQSSTRKRAYWKSRLRFLQSVKLSAGCVDCGLSNEATQLHFDHRPGTIKEFEPSHGKHRSWSKLLAEIEKCDVRCISCHSKRHAQVGGS